MEKKYQIFVSSTYEDLIEERKKVEDTILEMYHFPIGMEMFSAADEEQWEIIQETIDSSDYYVLIIGHRYGSVIQEGKDAGISYTQKEFRYALEKKIPVLVFLIADDVAVTPDKMEKNAENKQKLEEFINEATTGRTVQWWTSREDLANKVMNALNKEINRGKRPGWIRADVIDIEATEKELLEMSKKIRKLEEENEELKKSVITRKPQLVLEINNAKSIQIPFLQEANYVDCEYAELSMGIVPDEAKEVITQEILDDYNRKLPTREEIEEYKGKYRLYQQVMKKPYDLDLKISNVGNKKANDIYIEIYFPKELVVYKKNAIKNLTPPEKPSKPENPIDKFFKDKIPYSKINMMSTISPNFVYGHDFTADLDILEQAENKNKYFFNDDNSISIRMKDLMTDYEWSIKDKYVLAPMKRGEFEITCCFICEEYEETVEQKIQVVVK